MQQQQLQLFWLIYSIYSFDFASQDISLLANQALYDRPSGSDIIKYCWDTRVGAKAEDACHKEWLACGSDTSDIACITKNICEIETVVDYRTLLLTLGGVLLPVIIGILIRR